MALEFVKVGRTERMKVQILRGVVANGRPYDVGEIADLPAGDAHLLLSIGSARKFVEPVAAVAPPVEPVEKAATAAKQEKKK